MRTITLSMIDRTQYDENETGQTIESTVPVVINAESIRCFYQRKGGRVGTRITFADRGGFAVAETVDAVFTAVTGEPAPLALVPPPAVAVVPDVPAIEALPDAATADASPEAPARRRRNAH